MIIGGAFHIQDPASPARTVRMTSSSTSPASPSPLVLQGFTPPLALRDFKLAAFDMDSTLISIECIDEIAAAAGRKAEVAAITEAAMRTCASGSRSTPARASCAPRSRPPG